MLMGSRELCKIGAHNAIIEGDSFSAIRWGPGKSCYPWKLADWVGEIHHIADQLGCQFNHISRGENEIADDFARLFLNIEMLCF